MRKILICLIGAIILSNTQIGCKQSSAQIDGRNITTHEFTIDGMKYVVFHDGHGISSVNITRDKLQCEIIQENLKKIRNGNTSKSSGGND